MAKKILVIDDEYDVVELVKAVLKTKGHRIIVAYDGEEGFRQLLQEKPDLAVVDLRMPGMSGVEFCRRVRRTPEVEKTPLLVISSLTTGADKPDWFWAEGLGSDDFLPKPFDPLSLLGRVEYLLRKGEYVSEARAQADAEMAQEEAETPPAAGRTSRAMSPEDVVREFVESWNTRDFTREYDTLAEEMLGGVSREDYVQRRAQLYTDQEGHHTRQQVLDTIAKISHNVATVACLREDLVKGAPRRKDERYTLKRTATGWKIIGVKSQPITFTVE